MKKTMTTAILVLAVTAHAKEEKKRVFEYFSELFGKFGQNSTTQVRIVSGPKRVTMRNGHVEGTQWMATSGGFWFKITIQNSTKVKPEEVVERLEMLPMPYMRACEVVSDATEDGIAIYESLGGASAHGGDDFG